MAVSLRPLVEEDLEFLSEVRHHPDTLPFLHDQRNFPLAETRRWFRETCPEWSLILQDGERAGYIRTADHDLRNRSLKIGADIHPKLRRQGIATAAYRLFLEQLLREGWERVWLEVLPHNAAAIALYEQLGFQHEGRLVGALERGNAREDSLIMGRLICPPTGRNVKVVVVYLGPRRFRPKDPEDCFRL